MAELWELICHHTYAGLPGVIADLSGAGSPGFAADGLSDTNFLSDGAGPRSGSVRFYDALGRVHVPVSAKNSKSWSPLSAIRGTVTLRWQPSPPGAYTILQSDSFHFYMRSGVLVAWFACEPLSYAEISVHNDQVGPQPFIVPTGRWVTLGFMHDGLNTMELYGNGRVIARKVGAINSVAGASLAGISIGNTASGSPLNGEIDDVKLWRLNPFRIPDEFFDRPMDAATIDCYKRFFAELEAAFRRHPGCAALLESSSRRGVNGLLQDALARGPETQKRLSKSSVEYRRLWRAGLAGSQEMADLLMDMLKWLQMVGLDPNTDPRLQQIMDSECWRTIIGEVTPPECDTQLAELVRRIAGGRSQASAV